MYKINGELAQSGRAPALQAGGNRFETDILHHFMSVLVRLNRLPSFSGVERVESEWVQFPH